MVSIGDMIRQNVTQAQSSIQRARTRIRSRAEGLLPMPSGNPGGVLSRLRSGGPILGASGGIMERVQEARQRLTGGSGAGGVLGEGKILEAGPTISTKAGKIRTV